MESEISDFRFRISDLKFEIRSQRVWECGMIGSQCLLHITKYRGRRTGAATLDYVLVMAVVLPLIAFVLRIAPRIMNLVYEMTSVLISWPFM